MALSRSWRHHADLRNCNPCFGRQGCCFDARRENDSSEVFRHPRSAQSVVGRCSGQIPLENSSIDGNAASDPDLKTGGGQSPQQARPFDICSRREPAGHPIDVHRRAAAHPARKVSQCGKLYACSIIGLRACARQKCHDGQEGARKNNGRSPHSVPRNFRSVLKYYTMI